MRKARRERLRRKESSYGAEDSRKWWKWGSPWDTTTPRRPGSKGKSRPIRTEGRPTRRIPGCEDHDGAFGSRKVTRSTAMEWCRGSSRPPEGRNYTRQ
eukprot:9224535-Heterocapsa_arctica.AAC.1